MMFVRKVMVVLAIERTMTLMRGVTGAVCANSNGLKVSTVETILLAMEALVFTSVPRQFRVAVTNSASLLGSSGAHPICC